MGRQSLQAIRSCDGNFGPARYRPLYNICTIDATYAEESVLSGDGKIDYRALKPVLFEMPTYEYLRTGDIIGKCMSLGREQAK